ncbi:hypothetical protein [Streptomyces vietnamensis]|uniref:Uncharacterized protein n=1 Tax=Streptomyces vietnamensis TaxID=362257 RepID=A0A0B5IL59_9ACTN|nr:hypothetical protein [Streptomyces vietnamensis]AJF70373.1 hypothetical protein SVTN_39960 [Streptomyces vietnamensis]
MKHPNQDLDTTLTIDDLLKMAHNHGFPQVSRRLVTDWIEIGLLCRPEFQKTTRHGSGKRTFPLVQGHLFIAALRARRDLPQPLRYRRSVSLRIVIYLWLLGLVTIPTEQARRALRTFCQQQFQLPQGSLQDNAAMLVRLVTHPDAPRAQIRKATLVLENALATKQVRWDIVESALTEVCSPWPARPGQRIERGLLLDGEPAGIPEFVDGLRAIHQAAVALAAEQITAEQLDEARSRYLQRFGPRAIAKSVGVMLSGRPATADMGGPEIERFHLILSDLVNRAAS